jgi:hypothetical protein
MSGRPSFPWSEGDALYADELNAAIANAGAVPVGGSIQAAVDALPATGGMVALSPNTTYLLTSSLTIAKPNVTISAPSWNTIIKRQPGVTGHLIAATGHGFVIRDVTVDGGGPAATGGSFEISTTGTDSLIYHCQVINAGQQGHIALNGAGSRAEGNRVIGLGTAQGGYGIWAIGGVKTFIINNHVTGTGIDGIGFNGPGTRVIGNYVEGCQCYAEPATVGGGQIAQYNLASMAGGSVVGNYIGPGGGSISSGLELNGTDISVIGNAVVGQQTQGMIITDSGGMLIGGNMVLNSGSNGAAGPPWTLSGLSLFGPLNNITITGNRFADTRATHVQQWGVYIYEVPTNNNVIITDNDFTGNTLGGVYFPGPGTGHVIANNLGAANVPGVPAVNAASDAAAASAGVIVGGEYRNGSVRMVRVA